MLQYTIHNYYFKIISIYFYICLQFLSIIECFDNDLNINNNINVISNPLDSTSITNSEIDSNNHFIRTATGGLIHNLLILLTMLAFAGNAIFIFSVFWGSK